ncbi:MAG: O-acetyl-ADP-ribose deacetylase [Thermodesulfobacteriota bacterium]
MGGILEKEIIDRLEIQKGDITRLMVDAIVNAANSSLMGGGGVDGAIHRAAGPELLAECRTLGGCPPGEARITKGYRLPARYVIHSVAPIYSGIPEDRMTLSRCYFNSITLADTYGIKQIAFPAIGCGAYGYPIEEASRIALETTCSALKNHPGIQKVIFICFSEGDFSIYKRHLKSMKTGLQG